MWKEPCRKQVIDNVQIDHTKFEMFMSQNVDVHVGLRTPISMVVPNVVANDGVDKVEEYDFSFKNDG